jgi:hypothetical protein
MGSRLALATQDWEGHLAGDGECLNQNEGARPPRDRTGSLHMDLLGGKYKVCARRRAQRNGNLRPRLLVRERKRWPCEIVGQPALRIFRVGVVSLRMRYHKAIAIHKVEADFIADTSVASRNENVVICHGEQWYDVRALTEKELEEFVSDLLRTQLDQLRAGLLVPH